jgi:hypothetical protein
VKMSLNAVHALRVGALLPLASIRRPCGPPAAIFAIGRAGRLDRLGQRRLPDAGAVFPDRWMPGIAVIIAIVGAPPVRARAIDWPRWFGRDAASVATVAPLRLLCMSRPGGLGLLVASCLSHLPAPCTARG